MVDLKDTMNDYEEQGVSFNAIIYYAGHGLQKTMTYAATNSNKDYPLEKMLRTIAAGRKKTHIAAVFDCCRAEMRNRGVTGGSGADSCEEEVEGQTNLTITFACPPSDTTPAKSTISVQYFEQLKSRVEDATGIVNVQNALIGWRNTDKKAETIFFSPNAMKLKLVGHEPKNVPATTATAGAASSAELDALRA